MEIQRQITNIFCSSFHLNCILLPERQQTIERENIAENNTNKQTDKLQAIKIFATYEHAAGYGRFG